MDNNKTSRILKDSNLDVHSPEIQKLLLQAIKNDDKSWEAVAATKKIDSQDDLINIVKSNLCLDVRWAAVKRITNEEALLDIVKTYRHWLIRTYAALGLKDQAKIAEALQYDFDLDSSRKLLKRVRTQRLLAEIAISAHAGDIRCEAMQRIPPRRQDLFCRIVKNSTDNFLRGRAVKYIQDLRVLVGIINDDCNSQDIQKQAIANVDDRDTLIKIINTHPSVSCRIAAVERICDQTDFIDIARHNDSSLVRAAAIPRIISKEELFSIATIDPSEDVRARATAHIYDGRLLLQIIESDRSVMVQMEAIKNLKDQLALAAIALNDRHPENRIVAVGNITNQVVLMQVAKTDLAADVRRAAIVGIDDQRALIELADYNEDNLLLIFDELGIL